MREYVFPLVSLGSPAAHPPDAADVARWIGTIKGNTADLLTYNLSATLASQKPHTAEPTAGGEFYRPRIEEMLGAVDGVLKQEPQMQMETIRADLSAVKIKHAGFSLPAFSELALTDAYLDDADEFEAAGVEAYTALARELRDSGATRTILHAEKPGELELETLRGKKYLWVTPADELERVLEISRDVVLDAADVSRLLELTDCYDMRYVYLRDADAAALSLILTEFDKEYVFVAGYGDGEEYWKNLSEMKIQVNEE